MKHAQRFVWLDLARGLSALAVCAGHLRAATLVDYASLRSPSLFDRIFYFATGLGHQAVMVFFVLSGLFVGGSILGRKREFDAVDYSVARLSRLWVVLIPALLITALINAVLAHVAPGVLTGRYAAIWHSGPLPGQYSGSVTTFFGNVFFLQNIVTPVFGVDGQLWSLANEFWYYALFPLILFACGAWGGRTRTWNLLAGAGALLLMWWLHDFLVGFAVWLLGVGVYWMINHVRVKRRPFALGGTLLLFIAGLVYSKSGFALSWARLPSDLVVGASFAPLCTVIAMWPAPVASWPGRAAAKVSRGIAEFSYSLYVFHFPFLVLLAAFVYAGTKVVPDAWGFAEFAGEFLLLIGIGIAFWYLFERNTPTVRGAIRRYVGGFATPHAGRTPERKDV